MDAIHDLGGMEGFGPIPIDTGDAPFTYAWEQRMWGLARAGIAHGITIDWFRHGLELMPPRDYLNFRYFNKWCANYFMLMIDAGTLSLDEVASGHSAAPVIAATPLSVDDIISRNRGSNVSFARETDAAPAFAPGDNVGTLAHGHSGHTRLPRYARSRTGTIVAHHGAHVLADDGARGIETPEHLYTVSFSARELWGPDANENDDVTLDLWESYLVPA